MNPSNKDIKRASRSGQSQKGQIVVEYVLLLMVAVGVAALLTRTMVSRNQDSQGFLITKWVQINLQIAQDPSDDIFRNE